MIDSTVGKGPQEEALIRRFRKKGIPFVVVYNKCDLLSEGQLSIAGNSPQNTVFTSARPGTSTFRS